MYHAHIILSEPVIFAYEHTCCQEVVPHLFSSFLVPHLHALGHASVYAEPSDPAKGTQELVRARVHASLMFMCIWLCANVWIFGCFLHDYVCVIALVLPSRFLGNEVLQI